MSSSKFRFCVVYEGCTIYRLDCSWENSYPLHTTQYPKTGSVKSWSATPDIVFLEKATTNDMMTSIILADEDLTEHSSLAEVWDKG